MTTGLRVKAKRPSSTLRWKKAVVDESLLLTRGSGFSYDSARFFNGPQTLELAAHNDLVLGQLYFRRLRRLLCGNHDEVRATVVCQNQLFGDRTVQAVLGFQGFHSSFVELLRPEVLFSLAVALLRVHSVQNLIFAGRARVSKFQVDPCPKLDMVVLTVGSRIGAGYARK